MIMCKTKYMAMFIGFALAVMACLPATGRAADIISLAGGSVGQGACAVRLPDGTSVLAVTFAYSDNVFIYEWNKSSRSFDTRQVMDVGYMHGLANDLPRDILPLDVNRDGYEDLVVLNSGNTYTVLGTIEVLEGRPDGFFIPLPTEYVESQQPYTSNNMPVTLAAGQLNSDPHMDFAVGLGSVNRVALQRGEDLSYIRWMTDVNPPPGDNESPGVQIADLDGDGINDLITGSGSSIFLHKGKGNFIFDPPSTIEVFASYPYFRNLRVSSLAIADLNQNGRLDLIAGCYEGFVLVYWDPVFDEDHRGKSRHDGSLHEEPLLIRPFGSGPQRNVSDVDAVDWDMDGQPEVVAVNRIDNLVGIIRPGASSPLAVYQTAQGPRRMAIADLNSDGSPDIATANQGDLNNPDNPDVTVILNPNTAPDGMSVISKGRMSVQSVFPASLQTAGALVPLANGGVMAADPLAREFVAFTAAGQPMHRSPFPGETMRDIAGMIYSAGSTPDLQVLERRGQAIRRIRQGQVVETIPISNQGIYCGLSGLARDPSSGDFWTINVSMPELLRLSPEGAHLSRHKFFHPYATALAVDFNAGHFYLGGPGMAKIVRYTMDRDQLVQRTVIPLAQFAPWMTRNGVAAMAWNSATGELCVITTDPVLLILKPSGYGWTLSRPPVSLSRGRRVASLDLDESTGDLLALDLTGIPAILRFGADRSARGLFSLENLLRMAPGFRPSAIAYESATDSILISDTGSPFMFRMTLDSSIPGFLPSPLPDFPMEPPVTGLAHQRSGGVLIRTRRGVQWLSGDEGRMITAGMDGADPGDITAGERYIYTLSPRSRRLQKTRIADGSPTGNAFLGRYFVDDQPQGLAFNENKHLLYMSTTGSGEILIFEEEHITAAAPVWNQYE